MTTKSVTRIVAAIVISYLPTVGTYLIKLMTLQVAMTTGTYSDSGRYVTYVWKTIIQLVGLSCLANPNPDTFSVLCLANPTRRMSSLWDRTQKLPKEYFKQVEQVYGEHFPLEVRILLVPYGTGTFFSVLWIRNYF